MCQTSRFPPAGDAGCRKSELLGRAGCGAEVSSGLGWARLRHQEGGCLFSGFFLPLQIAPHSLTRLLSLARQVRGDGTPWNDFQTSDISRPLPSPVLLIWGPFLLNCSWSIERGPSSHRVRSSLQQVPCTHAENRAKPRSCLFDPGGLVREGSVSRGIIPLGKPAPLPERAHLGRLAAKSRRKPALGHCTCSAGRALHGSSFPVKGSQ